jgi:hypothetical protein
MSTVTDTASAVLWQRLVESHRSFLAASADFFRVGVDRVELLRHALRSSERTTALALARYLSLEDRQNLFAEWVFLASFAHGSVQVARDMILSLPRDFVLANVEQVAEPLLADGTYDEYRRLLELYDLLDGSLMRKLARRAAAHPDPDIREAGEDFLAKKMTP